MVGKSISGMDTRNIASTPNVSSQNVISDISIEGCFNIKEKTTGCSLSI